MRRIIYRDRNRRMYDKVAHKAITLNGLRELVRVGVEFKVIERATNRDITKEMLLKLIIMEDEILTIDILREIILANNGNFKAKLSSMLIKTVKDFSESRYKYLLN